MPETETVTKIPSPSRGARVLMAVANQGIEDDHSRCARTLESMSGVIASDTVASLTIIALRLLARVAAAENTDQVTILQSVDSVPESKIFGGPINTGPDDGQHTVSSEPRR
jgi:hypothetical protein